MALLSTALILVGCGSSDISGNDGPAGSTSEGHPVTVDSAYGEFTLDERPERIVTVNYELVDVLAALDVDVPVIFGQGDEETLLEVSPWIEGLYDEYDSGLASSVEWSLFPEVIAAQDSDLIVTFPSWIPDDDTYEQLSQIAPVYVAEVDGGQGWRDWTADLGALTGNSQKAEDVISDVDAYLSDARDRLPGLRGATFNAAFGGDGVSLWLAGGYEWVEDLGLILADNQPTLAAEPSVQLSPENLDQFAGDVVSIMLDSEEDKAPFDADPRFSELPASNNGTVLWVDRPVGAAMTAHGPISLRWFLEQILPQLEQSPLNSNGR